jgi:hypothetical protein
VLTFATLPDRMPWARWLSPIATGGAEDALARERLAAASPGDRAAVADGEGGALVFLKNRVVITARKPG